MKLFFYFLSSLLVAFSGSIYASCEQALRADVLPFETEIVKKAVSATDPVRFVESLSEAEIRTYLAQGIEMVPELRWIRRYASERNETISFFGGSVIAYVDFWKGRLLMLLGHPDYQQRRYLKPSIVSIFRFVQDIDIMTSSSAEELKSSLDQKFPYQRGEEHPELVWEVRNEQFRVNPNFPLLHHNSFEVGMLQISEPTNSFFTTVWDINNVKKPARTPTLSSIWNHRLEFLYSNHHESLNEVRNGQRPAGVSVIRFLMKGVEYNAPIDEFDLHLVEQVAAGVHTQDFFISKSNPPDPIRWIRWAAKKMVKGATDLEQAHDLIARMKIPELVDGLIQEATARGLIDDKKVRTLGPADRSLSLAWWLARPIMRDRPLDRDSRKPSAADLRIRDLYLELYPHQLEEFELLKFSKAGLANFFADHADGSKIFSQTPVAPSPQWGIFRASIRLRLKGEAKKGTDFDILSDGTVHVWNRNAIEVVPDSVKWDVLGALETLVKNPRVLDSLPEQAQMRLWYELAFELSFLSPGESSRASQLISQLQSPKLDLNNQ